ncbi:hypothetical protein OIU84_028570 [Salix udensis]|uniref:Cytochrome P450 n=1 Tax=Salix udensis TaxID=889485 RepID=A0AAD6KEY2_9ROSI|nr:hypothetical protein OIU84_028570 [Salix udensis]
MSKGEPILRSLHAKFGPIITLNIGARPVISMADRNLCHKALIRNGALYADRPEALPVDKIISSNQLAIVYSSYGPTWRLLRRNLTAEILNPSAVKSYSRARDWVVQTPPESPRVSSKIWPSCFCDGTLSICHVLSVSPHVFW